MIYYHFWIPKGDFHFRLCALGNGEDVCNFDQFVKENKIMHVYTEHGITNLLTYSIHANGPRKVIIEEITEAVDMNEPSSSNTSQMPER